MGERYRLVFRGEVLDGQHTAVVKKKLGEALKVAGERLDALFAGKAVVIRRDVDTAEAARYQAAFKRAGAHLRVMPVDSEVLSPAAPEPAPPAAGLSLAPLGELLRPEERRRIAAPNISIGDFTLAVLGTNLSTPTPPMPQIDAPEWVLSELGENLSDAEPIPLPEPDVPAWSVAKPGVLLVAAKPPVAPSIDLKKVDFPLSPPGTHLEAEKPTPPPAPDTSHLSLAD
jgi:hypothetical protein